MEEPPADLAPLAERFPGWHFDTVWAGAASGSDRRLLRARRDGITLTGWTPADLAEQIERAGR